MTAFSLVRHAAYGMLDQGLGGRDPHTLNEEGRAQAARIAEALQASAASAIIASPVRRAMETAETIGARLRLPVTPDDAFAEIDFGQWTGAAFAELKSQPLWARWNQFRSMAHPPGGESILAVQARAVAGLAALSAAYPEGTVIVVSHADVIKTILAHFLGMPLDLLRRLTIQAASVSRVDLWEDDARVVEVNRCV